MNLCVVSSFQGDVDEFMSMMEEFGEELKSAASEWECGVVNTNKAGFSKIITIANVIDEERLQQIMSSPKMVEWDKAHNNTDIIYSLERIN
ncbi:MAG: hypothetical protein VX966_05770 [Chloroflexota bacterium]|nr:hypothetical protein [Chloroflexota bacterium]